MFITLIVGIVAGLRALTPLAAVSWAARLGILHLNGTWIAFLGYRWSPWIFSLLALAEIVNDKLPQTPSRKVPVQFATRIITGAFAGMAIGTPEGLGIAFAVVGAIGAVIGTLVGAWTRASLVKAIGGRDLPIALLEDCIAVGTAALAMSVLG
ncbi:DUF4126 family protein [Terriglobus roseus]|uniref:Uncharacterized membrane protein n=1 Tax=Terriglobus roseus TaxID=392734 RepID=A0A1G7H0A4_9BACT|nr:DUF4126 family protein [Terriglobus roseus]SDE93619.1 Uncharacterized membrane protein [Terriglobus roseus]